VGAAFNGPIELVTAVADSELTQNCFATTWAEFAYGRKLQSDDACAISGLEKAFAESGYNVRGLLLALTQTEPFLYLPSAEPI
jgi:hypothetical protein